MADTIKLISKGATNLWQGTAQFYALKFKADKIDRDTMNKFLTTISKDIASKGIKGQLYVNTFYDWRSQYRSSAPFNIGDAIRTHDLQEYDDDIAQKQDKDARFSDFTVYFRKAIPRAGGDDDEHNDCLYVCLCQYYNGYENFPKGKDKIQTKTKLKKFLKLERNDKVPVESLQKLANYLNLNFSVSGDVELLTTGEYNNTISITLKKEHYKIKTEKKVKTKNVYKPKEKILAYKQIEKNNNETYDVEQGNRTNVPDLEIKEERFNPKSKYVLLRIEKSSKLSLEEEYNIFKKNADEIKEKSKGLINLYLYGNDYSTLAKLLFNQSCKEIIDCEQIDQKESDWLKILGGITYFKAYEGDAWSYDINSSYSAEMSKKSNCFPVAKPEFKIVKANVFDEHGYYHYGIYRAKVGENDNSRFFRYSRDNKYTHIDLTLARQLKLPIEIIQDGEHNAMLYSGKKVSGTKLFKGFVDKLFAVQECGLSDSARKIVKVLRNSLWGALAQRNKTISKKNIEDKVNVPTNNTILNINENKDNSVNFVVSCDNEKKFITNYARIAPFLTAMARRAIYRYAEPHKDYIVRVHTDSICLNKNVEIKTSQELGDLKAEKQGKIKITSLNDFLWN